MPAKFIPAKTTPNTEMQPEPFQTSEMVLFAKVNGFNCFYKAPFQMFTGFWMHL